MKLPRTQADIILSRCRQALADQRKRARADFAELRYGVQDLLVLAHNSPLCYWCRAPLSFGFEFDHKLPIARSHRAHTIDNICCSCSDCNQAHGGWMDEQEFRALLQLLDSFDVRSRRDVLTRLKAGGSRFAGKRRKGKAAAEPAGE
jgi:hypothetical protein